MDRFDLSPLFRSTIGFDRLTRLVDAATRVDSASLAYPPYNIEKTGEDAYRLTMAVDRKSTRLNSSHRSLSRMPSSA